MPDLLGDALVPAAVEVDLPGGPHDDADRRERPRARHPQLGRPGDVADVGLAAEHQDVEIVGLHLGQRALASPGAQCAVVGQDLSAHWPCPYGA